MEADRAVGEAIVAFAGDTFPWCSGMYLMWGIHSRFRISRVFADVHGRRVADNGLGIYRRTEPLDKAEGVQMVTYWPDYTDVQTADILDDVLHGWRTCLPART